MDSICSPVRSEWLIHPSTSSLRVHCATLDQPKTVGPEPTPAQAERPDFGKSCEERQSDVLQIEESKIFPAVWR